MQNNKEAKYNFAAGILEGARMITAYVNPFCGFGVAVRKSSLKLFEIYLKFKECSSMCFYKSFPFVTVFPFKLS